MVKPFKSCRSTAEEFKAYRVSAITRSFLVFHRKFVSCVSSVIRKHIRCDCRKDSMPEEIPRTVHMIANIQWYFDHSVCEPHPRSKRSIVLNNVRLSYFNEPSDTMKTFLAIEDSFDTTGLEHSIRNVTVRSWWTTKTDLQQVWNEVKANLSSSTLICCQTTLHPRIKAVATMEVSRSSQGQT